MSRGVALKTLRLATTRDVALAVGLCTLGWPGLWTSHAQPGVHVGALADLLGFVQAAPLALRRRWPLAVLLVISCAATAYSSLGYPTGPFGFAGLAALATLAYCRPAAVSSVGLCIGIASVAAIWGTRANDPHGIAVVANVAMVLASWAGGVALRSNRLRSEALGERASAIAALALEEARHVADRERLEVATMVHDKIGHALAGVLRQAEYAQRAPEDSRAELLCRMTERIRGTLGELAATVIALSNADPTPPPLAPVASGGALYEALDRWSTELGQAGVEVHVEVDGPAWHLGGAADVLAGRVVAEALSNIARHSLASTVDARITLRSGHLELVVADPGPPRAASGGSGQGLSRLPRQIIAAGGEMRCSDTSCGNDGSLPTTGFTLQVGLALDAPGGAVTTGRGALGR